jgi:hypothetical protein
MNGWFSYHLQNIYTWHVLFTYGMNCGIQVTHYFIFLIYNSPNVIYIFLIEIKDFYL